MNEILEREGSVFENVGVKACADLDGHNSSSIQRMLKDSGNVLCSNDNEYRWADRSNYSASTDSDSVCSNLRSQRSKMQISLYSSWRI